MAKKSKAEIELDTLITETVREEAVTELKRNRIKALLAELGEKEHASPSGESAKVSSYTEWKFDEATAKKVLDEKTFAMLFPPKGDSKLVTSWAASDEKNKALADKFRSGKESAARLYLSAAK